MSGPVENGERLATIPRRDGDELRLSWAEYNGHNFLNVRVWHKDDFGVGQPKKNGASGRPILSQRDAARQAGLSKHDEKQARRVANDPAVEFEEMVESVCRLFLDRIPTTVSPLDVTDDAHLVRAQWSLRDDEVNVANHIREVAWP